MIFQTHENVSHSLMCIHCTYTAMRVQNVSKIVLAKQQLAGGQNHENKIQNHLFFNSIIIASVFWISPILAIQKLEQNLHWFYLIK